MDRNSLNVSLLKKKKQQWAKEKAETEIWFPFGRPGAGAPNTSSNRLEYSNDGGHLNDENSRWSSVENLAPNTSLSKDDGELENVSYTHPSLFPLTPSQQPSASYPGVSPFYDPYYGQAGFMPYTSIRYSPVYLSQNSPYHHNGPTMPFPAFRPSFVGHPTNGLSPPQFATVIPSDPMSPLLDELLSNQPRMVAVTATNGNAQGILSPAQESSHRSIEDKELLKHQKELKAQQTYDNQIAEKRAIEEWKLKEGKRQEQLLELERLHLDETREQQAAQETHKWKQRMSSAEQHERAMTESLAKAKKEAEIARKARLFRHTLNGCDSPLEKGRELVGEDQLEQFNQAREWVESVDRQKRKENECRIRKKEIQTTRLSSAFSGDDPDRSTKEHSTLERDNSARLSLRRPKTFKSEPKKKRCGSLERIDNNSSATKEIKRTKDSARSKSDVFQSTKRKDDKSSNSKKKTENSNPWGESLGGLNPLFQPLLTRSRTKSRTSTESASDASPIAANDFSTPSKSKPMKARAMMPNCLLTPPDVAEERKTKDTNSLERFNHKSPQYRSFNAKTDKGSDRQQKILNQLAALRAQLKTKQKAIEQSISPKLS